MQVFLLFIFFLNYISAFYTNSPHIYDDYGRVTRNRTLSGSIPRHCASRRRSRRCRSSHCWRSHAGHGTGFSPRITHRVSC